MPRSPYTWHRPVHLAGFRHVVASLWPLVDEFAAATAHQFYRRLPNSPNADPAAITLHGITHDRHAQRLGYLGRQQSELTQALLIPPNTSFITSRRNIRNALALHA